MSDECRDAVKCIYSHAHKYFKFYFTNNSPREKWFGNVTHACITCMPYVVYVSRYSFVLKYSSVWNKISVQLVIVQYSQFFFFREHFDKQNLAVNFSTMHRAWTSPRVYLPTIGPAVQFIQIQWWRKLFDSVFLNFLLGLIFSIFFTLCKDNKFDDIYFIEKTMLYPDW